MNINIFATNSPNNQLEKVLVSIATTTGYIKDPTERKKPVVRFKLSDLSNLENCNYFYIPDFRRYYFKTGLTNDNGECVVTMREDVLMSWKDEIKMNAATVTRNENISNGYLNDPQFKAVAYEEIVTRQFPNAMEDDTLILMTVG